jgi:hypothetical protein
LYAVFAYFTALLFGGLVVLVETAGEAITRVALGGVGFAI